MSNKIVKITEEERQKQEDERFMNGRPNRIEVANYVNSLMEQKYMPEIERLINQSTTISRMGIMILQGILIDKGICTGEDIEKITKEFVEQQEKEMKKHMEDVSKEVTEEITK